MQVTDKISWKMWLMRSFMKQSQGEHFIKLIASKFHLQLLKATEILASNWLRVNLSVKIIARCIMKCSPGSGRQLVNLHKTGLCYWAGWWEIFLFVNKSNLIYWCTPMGNDCGSKVSTYVTNWQIRKGCVQHYVLTILSMTFFSSRPSVML